MHPDARMHRFREVPLAKEQALMPTFPDKDAAAKLGRPSRLQPSPDPRLQGSTIANASNATLAQRAAEVGGPSTLNPTRDRPPGRSLSSVHHCLPIGFRRACACLLLATLNGGLLGWYLMQPAQGQ